jgi:hypothetical protein
MYTYIELWHDRYVAWLNGISVGMVRNIVHTGPRKQLKEEYNIDQIPLQWHGHNYVFFTESGGVFPHCIITEQTTFMPKIVNAKLVLGEEVRDHHSGSGLVDPVCHTVTRQLKEVMGPNLDFYEFNEFHCDNWEMHIVHDACVKWLDSGRHKCSSLKYYLMVTFMDNVGTMKMKYIELHLGNQSSDAHDLHDILFETTQNRAESTLN